MAFIKTGLKPREFIEMDRFEKAAVIGFIQKYAETEKKGAAKAKGKGRRRRKK